VTLVLRVHQTAPRTGEPATNLAEMARHVGTAPPGSLVAFPELALTGYDLGSRARELALPEGSSPPVLAGDPTTTVVMGFPESAPDGRIYNAAGAAQGEGWLHVHRKRYLPTYGMFDEGRIFAPGGSGPRIFHPDPEWPTALLICEELWHPAMAYLAALRGAHLLLVLAAAPGRGTPGDADDPGARFGSRLPWRLLARTAAVTHGMYVALVNRSGVEGGVVFAGGSVVVAPDGSVVAEAPEEGEAVLEVELDPSAVRGARTPYAHIRDEDPALVIRELEEILRGGGIP